jgi:hypothetical protein
MCSGRLLNESRTHHMKTMTNLKMMQWKIFLSH